MMGGVKCLFNLVLFLDRRISVRFYHVGHRLPGLAESKTSITEQSLLVKLAVCQLAKMIPCLSWNQRLHYHVHKIVQVDPFLRQMNLGHTPHTIF
jgi:hypothetical protein